MEPHGPYDPPDAQRQLFLPGAFGARRELALQPKGKNSGRGGIPHYQWSRIPEAPTDARDYLARYAAEVRYLDQQVGWLLTQARRAGLLDDTAFVISSDHGEALDGDHGHYFSHDNGLTQDQIHVPLLLYYPGCEGGRVLSDPVSTTDIVPTALARLGLPVIDGIDGRDLLGEGERVVASETPREIALREGVWKLRRYKRRNSSELVDLRADPSERRNQLKQQPDRVHHLEERLREIQLRPKLAASIARPGPSDEHREELEALGYLE
jgi:arylsulfatase A-like enzyme